MNKRSDMFSITELYKSETVRTIVWRTLCPVFEKQFENLMEKGEVIESNLVKKAKNNKFHIKELFISFGFPLETLEDLKECLNSVKEVQNSPKCKEIVDGE